MWYNEVVHKSLVQPGSLIIGAHWWSREDMSFSLHPCIQRSIGMGTYTAMQGCVDLCCSVVCSVLSAIPVRSVVACHACDLVRPAATPVLMFLYAWHPLCTKSKFSHLPFTQSVCMGARFHLVWSACVPLQINSNLKCCSPHSHLQCHGWCLPFRVDG